MIASIISWILLVLIGFPALYMFVFAVCSKCYFPFKYNRGKNRQRFVILIPAYKSDSSIIETAAAAMNQDYPKELFNVLVISDSMQASTNNSLKQFGVNVLEVNFEVSSKAKSLQEAFKYLGPESADIVSIIDADNIVRSDYLARLNDMFESGTKAVQAHRTAKNADTAVATIDAVSEEINNSIFRKGHCAVGISSALIGSGMAFQYEWLRSKIENINTSGEDKEIEIELLCDGIFVDYASHIPILDEKTRTKDNYSRQHRRWIGTQYSLVGEAIRRLPSSKMKIGLADKALQWMLLPRLISIAMLPIGAIAASIAGISNAGYWWLATALMLLAMFFGIPTKMLNRDLFKALLQVPSLALTSIMNMFRLKGTNHNFIHTDHK